MTVGTSWYTQSGSRSVFVLILVLVEDEEKLKENGGEDVCY